LPGRRETFLIGERTVLLDGAHNPSAALALRATLTAPYVLLFGALPRKDGEATVGVLEPTALATFITEVDHQPSALSRLPSRTFIADPLEALQAALGRCPPEALVLVTGSLYLAGQLRPWLRGRLPACRPASSSPERSPP
jgi:dihydrofolate synthase/folylpolyglutamate synthase